MTSASVLSQCTDALIRRFGDSKYDGELRLAKESYSESRGRVFEEEEQWERFTRGLLEWYVAERPWGNTGLAPALIALKEEDEAETRRALLALAGSQRSLAEIVSLQKGRMRVVDLVGGAEFIVREERSLAGLQRGDVVELRLVGLGDAVLLGRTFLFHPDGTAKAISALAGRMRREGATRAAIVDRMALLRSRSQSYRHVPAVQIYASNGELARP